MPLLLYTYIATEILAPFFASFLIINAILFLGRLVPILNVIFDLGVSPGDFFRLCAYMLPNLMIFSIPMASMTAVIVAVSRMVNDNEIMALKATGIGLVRLLPPVIVIALSTSLLAYFSAVTLIPQGTLATKTLFLQMAEEKIDKGVQPGQFSEGLKNVVLYIDAVDQQTRQWQGVYVSDMRHGDTPFTIVAKTGSLDAQPENMLITLTLSNGTLHRAEKNITQTIRFDRYQINLPITPPTEIAGTSVSEVGKNGLSQSQLLEQVQKHGPKSAIGISLLIEYYTRMALPVGGFILTILGLPLAMLARPGRRPLGVPLGLLLFVIYYVLFTAGRANSENGHLPVVVGIWLSDILIAVFTVILTRQVAKETTPLFLTRLNGSLQTLLAGLPGIKLGEKQR
ncbi:MAG: LptF/LptG family permease [Desulfobulbaceae bacterium]|nr:LptF/LptG family permease [Desulfobulbaceae bacterium]HIJ90659.1 YjgP/YjgQ family permease [Deltaproteobacteria bacterium]